jgi:hypothetical protein
MDLPGYSFRNPDLERLDYFYIQQPEPEGNNMQGCPDPKPGSSSEAVIPPFPDDVPTAPLLQLSSRKLLAGDSTECERLLKASTEIGFFYLDLSDTNHGLSLLDDADALFKVGEELFQLSLDEKKRYDFSGQKSYFGYKGQGVTVVDKQGTLDRNEFYNASLPQTTLCFQTDRYFRSPRMTS